MMHLKCCGRLFRPIRVSFTYTDAERHIRYEAGLELSNRRDRLAMFIQRRRQVECCNDIRHDQPDTPMRERLTRTPPVSSSSAIIFVMPVLSHRLPKPKIKLLGLILSSSAWPINRSGMNSSGFEYRSSSLVIALV
jgi:hypothetical protein